MKKLEGPSLAAAKSEKHPVQDRWQVVPMPKQNPKERAHNFNEVALGYTEEQALAEASRCITCPKPHCVEGCPVELDIPAFIQLIKEKKYDEAIKKVKEKNSLPAICGRVCPQEEQCQKMCVMGKKGEPVSIGRLERFVADLDYIKKLGVELRTDAMIGRLFTIDELFRKGFDAVFIGTGAGLPQFLGIPGENLGGIYSSNEFLI